MFINCNLITSSLRSTYRLDHWCSPIRRFSVSATRGRLPVSAEFVIISLNYYTCAITYTRAGVVWSFIRSLTFKYEIFHAICSAAPSLVQGWLLDEFSSSASKAAQPHHLSKQYMCKSHVQPWLYNVNSFTCTSRL